MRTFLRHASTGQYFQSLDTWTLDRDEAYNFGLISRAMKFAQKLRFPGLELILQLDEPAELGDTPFEALLHKITKARAARRLVRSRRASRVRSVAHRTVRHARNFAWIPRRWRRRSGRTLSEAVLH